MQKNNTAAITNRLITVAQTAPNVDVRAEALHELWEIHGDRLVGIMGKTSRQMDSDFSYRGCSPKDRQAKLAGDAYRVFRKKAMKFDPSKRVPFGAWIAMGGNWRVMDEKKKNSKHGVREIHANFTDDGVSYLQRDKETGEEETVHVKVKARNYFEETCFREDVIRHVLRATEPYPRLHRFFKTCLEVLDELDRYNGAEVAKRMGCSRANAAQCRKALFNLAKEQGWLEDIYLIYTA